MQTEASSRDHAMNVALVVCAFIWAIILVALVSTVLAPSLRDSQAYRNTACTTVQWNPLNRTCCDPPMCTCTDQCRGGQGIAAATRPWIAARKPMQGCRPFPRCESGMAWCSEVCRPCPAWQITFVYFLAGSTSPPQQFRSNTSKWCWSSDSGCVADVIEHFALNRTWNCYYLIGDPTRVYFGEAPQLNQAAACFSIIACVVLLFVGTRLCAPRIHRACCCQPRSDRDEDSDREE